MADVTKLRNAPATRRVADARSRKHREYRDALGCFATGVTVITTQADGSPHGMTANGFMSVSLEPPLVVVSVAKRARMYELLAESGRYGVSVLTCEQERLSRHFAGRPLDGLPTLFTWVDGVPLIDGALTHIVARVVDAHPAGDHTLYIGEVDYFDWRQGDALIFHSGEYRQLVEAYSGGYADAWSGFALGPGSGDSAVGP